MQELSGIIESQRREIDHTLARDEQLRRDQQLFMNNYWHKIENFVKLMRKVSLRSRPGENAEPQR